MFRFKVGNCFRPYCGREGKKTTKPPKIKKLPRGSFLKTREPPGRKGRGSFATKPGPGARSRHLRG
jgi:hypothetical protein